MNVSTSQVGRYCGWLEIDLQLWKRTRNCHSQEEPKEIWQLNVMWGPGTEKKDIGLKKKEEEKKIWVQNRLWFNNKMSVLNH